jgi:hypothetical protein
MPRLYPPAHHQEIHHERVVDQAHEQRQLQGPLFRDQPHQPPGRRDINSRAHQRRHPHGQSREAEQPREQAHEQRIEQMVAGSGFPMRWVGGPRVEQVGVGLIDGDGLDRGAGHDPEERETGRTRQPGGVPRRRTPERTRQQIPQRVAARSRSHGSMVAQ